MRIPKAQILAEIKRTADENSGVPLGVARFEAETGIKNPDWFGVHWARWGDALREAGYEPNSLTKALDTSHLLRKYAELALELRRLPVRGDLKLKRKRDPEFPSWNTFDRLGPKNELVTKLDNYCRSVIGFESVVQFCADYAGSLEDDSDEQRSDSDSVGYVYLLKHGSRAEYKIGRTNNALRREGEIAIELPEKVKPIHVITTDDAAGIEAYWHKRFDKKRKNGEWFELDSFDVRAFKRRRFM